MCKAERGSPETEKRELSESVEFYKGKIRDMNERTELLQEKADNLEREDVCWC